MQDGSNRETMYRGNKGVICKLSVLFTQIFHKPQTAVKKMISIT